MEACLFPTLPMVGVYPLRSQKGMERGRGRDLPLSSSGHVQTIAAGPHTQKQANTNGDLRVV